MGRRWEGEVVEEGGLDPFGCGTLPRASSLWVYHQKTVGLPAFSGTSTGQSFPSRAITQSWWREPTWGEKRQVCKNQKLTHKWHPEKVKVSKGLRLLERCGTG